MVIDETSEQLRDDSIAYDATLSNLESTALGGDTTEQMGCISIGTGSPDRAGRRFR